jgi:hypothetical protein
MSQTVPRRAELSADGQVPQLVLPCALEGCLPVTEEHLSGLARMHSVDGSDTRVVEIRDQAVRQVECASWAEAFTVLRSLAQQR